jgi:Raf kinase inhibitor-like YbhB/YbcL family protein
MAFQLKTTAFKEGDLIPKQFTCDGPDMAPPLQWDDPPAKTRSFALIADDPDAPRGTWVHWVIYNIPGNQKMLEQGVKPSETLANGTRQGQNDFKRVGYGGPCPPPGKPHRYYFKLYALDTLLDLKPGATKAQVLEASKNHVLGETQLMGRYGRT